MKTTNTPRNSAGRPYTEGDTWSCSTCGQSGPDRDDRDYVGCLRNGRPHKDEPHDEIVFSAKAVSQ